MQFAIYDLASGRIARTFYGDEIDRDLNVLTGQGWVEGAFDDRLFWVTHGVAAPRPAMQPIVAGTVVSDLPQPVTATIEGTAYEVADGLLELFADQPGPYTIALTAFPYLDCVVTIA